jgi:23S rRNA (guanosine2251-2'-O)-methyltransferase
MQIAVLLHNVRSAHNVGSIFRTADAAGTAKVYLSGYTPTPLDRFGRPQKDIAKTALGAEKTLEWEYAKSPTALFKRLRKEGWNIVGVEQDPRAKNYSLIRANKRIVFIFGNEVRGLSKTLRDACDLLIEIPMHGKKESLNVSVTAGIILFSVRA